MISADSPRGPRRRACLVRDAISAASEHAVGDGFAVSEPAVLGDGLERVAGRVSEIQVPSQAGFPLVALDDRSP